MEYVVSFSGGKDSTAMLLMMMEKGMPITKVVFYDTGMEFDCIYRNLDKASKLVQEYGAELVVLKPERDFLLDMLVKPVAVGKPNERYGYDWCGGNTRWRTEQKVRLINRYLKSLGEYEQYIGIAADEPGRVKSENNKRYPLVDWGVTEAAALQHCYDKGWDWLEDGVELYSILDRVSCWCCGNKNLKELRNIYRYLPRYWGYLKGLQSRIDRPFRRSGETIFDLEERFKREEMVLWDEIEFTV